MLRTGPTSYLEPTLQIVQGGCVTCVHRRIRYALVVRDETHRNSDDELGYNAASHDSFKDAANYAPGTNHEPPFPSAHPHPASESYAAPEERRSWRGIGGTIAAIGFIALKFGKYAFIILKGSKFLTTSFTMLISIAAYALFFGWPYAFGVVVLLLIHEMGHVIQLQREGIKASAPVFIPFMGALVAMKDVPTNAAQEARVGIAGPILGTVGVLGVFGLAKLFDDAPILLALTFTGAMLNLFNLLPVSPLDGGRIAAALSPKLWIAGVLAMVGMVVMWPNPILILILIFGAIESWRRYRSKDENPRYFEVTPAERTTLAVSFVALAALLVLIMQATYVPRSL